MLQRRDQHRARRAHPRDRFGVARRGRRVGAHRSAGGGRQAGDVEQVLHPIGHAGQRPGILARARRRRRSRAASASARSCSSRVTAPIAPSRARIAASASSATDTALRLPERTAAAMASAVPVTPVLRPPHGGHAGRAPSGSRRRRRGIARAVRAGACPRQAAPPRLGWEKDRTSRVFIPAPWAVHNPFAPAKPPGRLAAMIPAPFLLYLGHSADPIGIKTSRGLADVPPRGLRRRVPPRRLPADARSAAADAWPKARRRARKTLVLGIANAGGTIGADLIDDAVAALDAGHERRLRPAPAAARRAAARGAGGGARARSCSTCAIRPPI